MKGAATKNDGVRRGLRRAEVPSVAFPVRVAAIDVGSNAIRFLAAEFTASDRFAILLSLRLPVRLGHGVFLSGKLSERAIAEGLQAIASFHQEMERLGVTHYRAVATSATREADNGADFLSRVLLETGVRVDLISGAEEARLVHLGVRNRLSLGRRIWLLVDIGGGSVELSLADRRGTAWSESHSMGSLRLLEEISSVSDDPGRLQRLLSAYIATMRLSSVVSEKPLAGMVGTGGSIESIAKLAGTAGPRRSATVTIDDLRRAIEMFSKLSHKQRVQELGLRPDRADVILPAALLYERILVLSGLDRITVPFVGVREGILLDLVDSLTMHDAHADRQLKQSTADAMALGRRYRYDEAHARHVADLSASLFDQLTEHHLLDARAKHLLVVAAVLHDIGTFVSYKRHHKHSLYLISEAEIGGFSPLEMQLVANVARYHRKSLPSPQHESFAALGDRDRELVSKLAAILRIADALDREHEQKVGAVRIDVRNREAVLSLEGHDDLLLTRWALRRKTTLFNRVFGLNLRLPEDGEPQQELPV
jgi:exopolyphosphatase/guanosine-5'-triphosphate,3'-diphosphate pyrophosphatase